MIATGDSKGLALLTCVFSDIGALNPAVARVLKRLHFPLDAILTCVRWYVAYPLSLRNLEGRVAERGVSVDHPTVHRWPVKLLPVLEKAFRLRKRPVDRSWRMDEIHQSKYLNNLVEQDHRRIKRRTRPMLGFKRFRSARILLGGIAMAHMIAKVQMDDRGVGKTPAEWFYSLAA